MPTVSSTFNRKLALVGLLALLPALFLEGVGLSFFLAPGNPVAQAMARLTATPQSLYLFNLISPMIMLGGGVLALALNLFPPVRLSFRKEREERAGPARIKGTWLNLSVAALSVLVMAVMIAYVIGENWQCLIGQKVTC